VIAYGAGVESESFVVDIGGIVVEGAGAGGGVPSSAYGVGEGSRTSKAVGRREGDNCIICRSKN
jgi:hypothetical protein